MFVRPGKVCEVMAWPCVRLARRWLCRLVRFLLRERLAAHLAQALQPWHGRVARKMIVDAIDQDTRHRIAAGVGEHGDAEISLRHQAHQRAPAEPAAGVPDNALAPVGG